MPPRDRTGNLRIKSPLGGPSGQGLTKCGSSLASIEIKNAQPVGQNLATVIDAWPSLPNIIQAGIFAIVEANQDKNVLKGK